MGYLKRIVRAGILTCWQKEKKPPCTTTFGSLLVVASAKAPSLLWSMEDFLHYIIWILPFFFKVD